MHLSTSNFERKAPPLPYKKIGLLGLILLCVTFFIIEEFWQSKQFLPRASGGNLLWSYHRKRASVRSSFQKVLVIVGASRAQLGIVPEILQKELGYDEVIQLSRDGTPPFPILQHLANDPDFHGDILASFRAEEFLPNAQTKGGKLIQSYEQHFSSLGIFSKLANLKIQNILQDTFVIFSSRLKPSILFKSSFSPKPHYLRIRSNFHFSAFYSSRLTAKELRAVRKKRVRIAKKHYQKMKKYPISTFDHTLKNKVVPILKNLESSQQKVVFLRMPTTDEHWKYDKQYFPKEKYWDRISAMTGAKTLHFKDDTRLQQFSCPDTSHLDAKDTAEFTLHLSHILSEKRWLEPDQTSPNID